MITDKEISTISALAKRQKAIEARIADQEDVLKKLNEELVEVSQKLLPNAMAEAGCTQFTLESGESIEIKDDVAVNISAANKERAYAWLRNHGLGAIIKNEVSVQLGKGQDELAQTLKEAIAKLNIPYSEKESIHHQTLKATIKEQLERGAMEIPSDLFGLFQYQKAKVK